MTRDEKVAQLGSFWAFEVVQRDRARRRPAGRAGRRRDRPDHAGWRARPTCGRSRSPQTGQRDPATTSSRRRGSGSRRSSTRRCLHGLIAWAAPCFQQSIGAAASFDPDVVDGDGRRRSAGGCSLTGARHALAPVLDIARDPRWGRIEETYGEDPYLAAALGVRLHRGAPGPGPRRWRGRHRQAHGRPRAGRGRAEPGAGPRRRRASCATSSCSRSRRPSGAPGIASIMPAYCDVDGVPCHASAELLDRHPARRVGVRRHRRLGLHRASRCSRRPTA